MKKRVYVMAVMIAVLMSFSNLTVNAQEKVKLNAASKEKTLEVTLELPVTEKESMQWREPWIMIMQSWN